MHTKIDMQYCSAVCPTNYNGGLSALQMVRKVENSAANSYIFPSGHGRDQI